MPKQVTTLSRSTIIVRNLMFPIDDIDGLLRLRLRRCRSPSCLANCLTARTPRRGGPRLLGKITRVGDDRRVSYRSK